MGITFVILSISTMQTDVSSYVAFGFGVLACLAVILIAMGINWGNGVVLTELCKYTMPVFLMHTMSAAPVRIILTKLGIYNAVIQLGIGLASSFFIPVVVAKIINHIKWMEFFIYPGKYVKISKNS